MHPIEKEIIDLLKVEDVRAVELIYDHYAPALYGIICRMVPDEDEAQDILHDALVRIWQHSATYDHSKGRLFTWLLSITRNAAIDAIRKLKRKPEIHRTSDNVFSENGPFHIPELGTQHDLEKVFNNLSSESKALIEHSYILGYSHPEIAEIFNLPLGTVKTRIRNALIELRNLLGNGHS